MSGNERHSVFLKDCRNPANFVRWNCSEGQHWLRSADLRPIPNSIIKQLPHAIAHAVHGGALHG